VTHSNAEATLPARRAAWQAYLVLNVELIPAARTRPLDEVGVISALAGFAIQIRRDVRWWPGQGPHLVAAIDVAIRLRAQGDRARLLALLSMIRRWLFALSSATATRSGEAA